MTREEFKELAEKKYPVQNVTVKSNVGDFYTTHDVNELPRKAFMEAYEILLLEHMADIDKTIDETKKYMLGKLPKWHKADRDIDTDILEYAILFRQDGGDYPDYDTVEVTNRLHKGEWYFELSDLQKLLKEE